MCESGVQERGQTPGMKREAISMQMVTSATGPGETRRGPWPKSKGTWSLRGQRNEEEAPRD